MPIHSLGAYIAGDGSRVVEVQVLPIDWNSPLLDELGDPILDAHGNPTYEHLVRMYLDEVPGGPGWPPARIQAAVDLFQSRLPQGLWVVNVAENPGKGHIDFTITRINPNG